MNNPPILSASNMASSRLGEQSAMVSVVNFEVGILRCRASSTAPVDNPQYKNKDVGSLGEQLSLCVLDIQHEVQFYYYHPRCCLHL
jgi:hypothetical protein